VTSFFLRSVSIACLVCARLTHPIRPAGFCPSGLCSAGGVRQARQVGVLRCRPSFANSMDGCAHTCLPAYPVFGCPFGCLSVCLLGFMELVRPSFHFSGRSCALTDTFCSVCGVSSHGMCGGMCAYRSDDIHPSSNTYTHTHTHRQGGGAGRKGASCQAIGGERLFD